jgi:hypothetical protein
MLAYSLAWHRSEAPALLNCLQQRTCRRLLRAEHYGELGEHVLTEELDCRHQQRGWERLATHEPVVVAQ